MTPTNTWPPTAALRSYPTNCTPGIERNAPIDGVVLSRTVNLGQVVSQAQELFVVTDLSSVWIEGDLLEDHFNAVNVGSRAAITTPVYPERRYRGIVEYIDPRVEAVTRTAKVRVAVENPGLALRLGMYMDMSFTSSASP